MPRKIRKRLSAESIRQAQRKGAASKKARRHVRTFHCGVMGPLFPASPCLTASPPPILQSAASGRSLSAAPGGTAVAPPSSSSSSDGEVATAAPLPSAVQPSEALHAAPPPPSPGAPLQVVSVVPSPVANRAAATATPDALASAEEGLLFRSALLSLTTPPVRSAPAPLQRHDPDMGDEEGNSATEDAELPRPPGSDPGAASAGAPAVPRAALPAAAP